MALLKDMNMRRPVSYQIKVLGWLDETWSDRFGNMTVIFERENEGLPVATLAGSIADQFVLRGILKRIWDMNQRLISVVPSEEAQGGACFLPSTFNLLEAMND